MRDFAQTLEWYRTHKTTDEIGFDPDGMCLKVCRTARGIDSLYPTAKVAQDNTPDRYRITEVADIRRGMIGYSDDPNDSNTAGHVYTFVGRVPGFDPTSLDDLLVATNSVVANKLTVVRASYFQEHWGDEFQFASNWLNGMVLDVPGDSESRVLRFRRSGPNYNVNLLDAAVTAGKRVDLERHVERINDAVAELPEARQSLLLSDFKESFEKRRILRMPLLDEAVHQQDRKGNVRDIRNKLRRIIKALPEA